MRKHDVDGDVSGREIFGENEKDDPLGSFKN